MTEMDGRWRRALISPEATIAEAIEKLNTAAIRLVLCVDTEGRLVGSLTDGDLRRGLLRGLAMDDPVSKFANPNPMVVPEGTGRIVVRDIMKINKLLQLPEVDIEGHVLRVHLWDTVDDAPDHDHTMVIMAGGKGTRLRPHTQNCPKPMLPVAGKPMLQHIIERAKSQGFGSFVLSLNYLGDIIRDHFGNGSAFGVTIAYVEEDKPLGTAGALSQVQPRPKTSFVVTNGDVLTDINYSELIEFHERHDADGVMAVRLHEWTNPYGVVQLEGMNITGIEEKPVSRSYINAGVYALSSSALEQLEPGSHCNMPTLFDRLRKAGKRTLAYPMHEPWLDVGRKDDLDRADKTYQELGD